MIDFKKQFETYNNIDLIKIIEEPNDYQPLAVEAAQIILATRQVTDRDFEIAKNELAVLNQDKEFKNQKALEFETKIKNIGVSILAAVNPLQTKPISSDRTIKILSIILWGILSFCCMMNLD